MAVKSANSLYVSEDCSNSEYEILVVSEKQLEQILNAKSVVIKDSSSCPFFGEMRSATLHTCEKTFDLTKVDSSNSFLYTEHRKDINEYYIHKMCHYAIELALSAPNKLQTVNTLRHKCLYKDIESEYSNSDIDDNKSKGLLFSELLDCCQISKRELELFLEELGAFLIDNKVFIFDIKDLLYRSKKLLLGIFKYKINLLNFEWKDVSHILNNIPISAGKIILNSIGNSIGGSEKWELNGPKIQLICSLLLFMEKKTYLLKEFVAALQKLENLLIPEEILIKTRSELDATWLSKNIFPGYQDVNLSFLQKKAYITPANQLKKEAIIEYIDYYQLSGNIKKRYNQISEKKKEWTKVELQIWLEEFLPLDLNLDNFLAKNAKLQIVPHPFTKGTIGVYTIK